MRKSAPTKKRYLAIEQLGGCLTGAVLGLELRVTLVLELHECFIDILEGETLHFIDAIGKDNGVLHCCHSAEASAGKELCMCQQRSKSLVNRIKDDVSSWRAHSVVFYLVCGFSGRNGKKRKRERGKREHRGHKHTQFGSTIQITLTSSTKTKEPNTYHHQ